MIIIEIREATCYALSLSLSIFSNPFTPYALAVIPLCNGGKLKPRGGKCFVPGCTAQKW